jgi:hypothetical protein
MPLLPYRPNALEWPLSPQQVEGLNATIENIYTELRRLTGGTAHDILSATHSDSEPAAEVDGDIITGQAGAWKRLPVGADKEHLVVDGTDPAWGTDGSALTDLNASNITTGTLDAARLATSGVVAGTYGDATHVPQVTVDNKGRVTAAADVAISAPTHSLLSTTHPDTTPASPTLGDLVVAQNAGALDVGKYFLDGVAFDYVPNANDVGAEAFWIDGAPGAGLVSSGAVKWARKANGTAGYVLTAGATGAEWQPASFGGSGVTVYRASNFILADRVATAVTHSTVTVDDSSFWSAGAPTRLTVPASKAGWYSVVGQAVFAAVTGRKVYAQIYVNGVERASVGGDAKILQVSGMFKLAVGDYVELYLYAEQNVAGDPEAITGGSASTFLSMVKL